MCSVSVVMATYNGEKFIAQQLASIIQQLCDDSEIIISDDGSTDKTIDIIKSFNDKRIKLVANTEKGLILNFQNALKKAAGNIIFLSDQDDVWLPGKVETCKNFLKQYHLVVTDAKVVNEDLSALNMSLFQVYHSRKGIIKNLMQNSFIGCCMAFRKEILPIALPFPAKIPMHDIWLGFIAEMFFSVHFIKDELILHRRHSANQSTTFNKSKYSFFQKLKFRINTIKYIPLLLQRKYLMARQ